MPDLPLVEYRVVEILSNSYVFDYPQGHTIGLSPEITMFAVVATFVMHPEWWRVVAYFRSRQRAENYASFENEFGDDDFTRLDDIAAVAPPNPPPEPPSAIVPERFRKGAAAPLSRDDLRDIPAEVIAQLSRHARAVIAEIEAEAAARSAPAPEAPAVPETSSAPEIAAPEPAPPVSAPAGDAEEPAKPASRELKLWADQEDELRSLWLNGVPIDEIARRLDRTVAAVSGHIYKLRLHLDRPIGAHATAAQAVPPDPDPAPASGPEPEATDIGAADAPDHPAPPPIKDAVGSDEIVQIIETASEPPQEPTQPGDDVPAGAAEIIATEPKPLKGMPLPPAPRPFNAAFADAAQRLVEKAKPKASGAPRSGFSMFSGPEADVATRAFENRNPRDPLFVPTSRDGKIR